MSSGCRLAALQARVWVRVLLESEWDAEPYASPVVVVADDLRTARLVEPCVRLDADGSARLGVARVLDTHEPKGATAGQRMHTLSLWLFVVDTGTATPCRAFVRAALDVDTVCADYVTAAQAVPAGTTTADLPSPMALRHRYTPGQRWAVLLRFGPELLAGSAADAIAAHTFGCGFTEWHVGRWRASAAGRLDFPTVSRAIKTTDAHAAQLAAMRVQTNAVLYAVPALQVAGPLRRVDALLVAGWMIFAPGTDLQPRPVLPPELLCAELAMRRARIEPRLRQILGEPVEEPECRAVLPAAPATDGPMPPCVRRQLTCEPKFAVRKTHSVLMAACPDVPFAHFGFVGYTSRRRQELDALTAGARKKRILTLKCADMEHPCSPPCSRAIRPQAAWFVGPTEPAAS